MKTIVTILAFVAFAGVASAQNPDPSKWMCRNLADSGNFAYQGETIFGYQACRPVPQAAPALGQPAPGADSNRTTDTSAPGAHDTTTASPSASVASATPVQTRRTTMGNDTSARSYPPDGTRPKAGIALSDCHQLGFAKGNSSGQVSGHFVNGTGSVERILQQLGKRFGWNRRCRGTRRLADSEVAAAVDQCGNGSSRSGRTCQRKELLVSCSFHISRRTFLRNSIAATAEAELPRFPFQALWPLDAPRYHRR